MIDWLKTFHDSAVGGAWSFLVRGVIRLVNSDNERDLRLYLIHTGLLGPRVPSIRKMTGVISVFRDCLIEGRRPLQGEEVEGNNRSVMPLDILGRTRATLTRSTSSILARKSSGNLFNTRRDGDRSLEL